MLLEAFRLEYREHVDGMRAALASDPPDLEEAFRRAHSLKAAARVCDFEPVADLSRRLESLFSRLRQERIAPADGVRLVALTGVEVIESWVVAQEMDRPLPDTTSALEALDQVLARAQPAAGSPPGTEAPLVAARAPDPATVSPLAGPSERTNLDRELLAAFLIEQREHLEGIRALLGGMEQGQGTPAQVEEAFRRAHSLKGAARVAEVKPAEEVAHRLESLFVQVREGLPLSPEVVRVIGRGLDFIEDAVACLLAGRQPPDPTAVLQQISSGVASDDQGVREGARDSRVASEEPSGDTAPALLATPHSPLTTHHPERATTEESVRVSADHLEQLLRSTDHLLAEGLTQDSVGRELARIERQVNELSREGQTARALAPHSSAVGVGAAQVLQHLQRVDEQVRGLARRVRALRRMHQRAAHTLRQLGRQLQQDVRRVRTVPAESVFHGFRKMMRGLAGDLGKEVDFRVTGLDVQADRQVLQALKDPLMHILRNAVHHGIEPPEERRRLGKNPLGQVSLLLQTQGNRLLLRVEDDGRGIDLRRIAHQAVQHRLLTEEQAAATTPEELARLVFRPGFSTAESVTDLAGRGMGLSVVQEAVARLQGEVRLTPPAETNGDPRPRTGWRITLSVPLSVSAHRLLLVSAAGQTFAVPFHGIAELRRVRRREIERLDGKGPLMLFPEAAGAGLLPVQTLGGLLGIGPALENGPGGDSFLSVVVVASGQERLALVVDEFVEECHALLRDLDVPARADTWAGAVFREDGSVCLVVNPAALLRRRTALPAASDRVPAPPRPAAPPRQHTILVVDDSLTTRTLERSILEAHGYRVRLALDGLEALNQLRQNPVDLVITDIQMPRLDGFGLLEALKREERLARIPVIVVTSLEKREDQERGLALGADAYIVKRKFDHEDLLQAVRQLL
jgi:two-component system chemotaxis sensor kinase CheA